MTAYGGRELVFGGNTNAPRTEYPTHAVVWREVDKDETWRSSKGRYIAFVTTPFSPRPDVLLPLIFIHDDGFTFKYKTAGELDPAEIKRLRRKAEESLGFGDEISFFMEDLKQIGGDFYVMQFQRHSSAKMKAFRIASGGQFLVNAVMDEPENAQLYTVGYGTIPLHINDVQRALPNIALKVWITLKEDLENKCFQGCFADFEAVDEDDQYMVGSTPWNKGNSKYELEYHSDSDSDPPFEKIVPIGQENDSERTPNMKRLKVKCIYTSHLNLFSERFKNDRVVMAFLKKLPMECPKIGETLICNLIWHHYEKYFVVYDWRLSREEQDKLLPTKKIGLFDTIQIGVREVEGCPGIFKHEKFGLIDDPEKKLSMHHLTRYKDSICRVYVKDDLPTKLGRFRILEVEAEKYGKIGTFLKANEIEVKLAFGIIISADGKTIFSAKHAPITFRFDKTTCEDWSHLKFGTKVKFMARYNGTYGVMDVTNFEILPASVEAIKRNDSSLWFHAKCQWQRNVFPSLLISEDFGPIDDINNQFPARFQPNRQYEIWVSASVAVTTRFPIAHTRFNAVWWGDAPKEPKLVDATKMEEYPKPEIPLPTATRFSVPRNEPTSSIVTNLPPRPLGQISSGSRFSTPSAQQNWLNSKTSCNASPVTSKITDSVREVEEDASSFVTARSNQAVMASEFPNLTVSNQLRKEQQRKERHAFITQIQRREQQTAPATSSGLSDASIPVSYVNIHHEMLAKFGLVPNSMESVATLLERAADIIQNEQCCGQKCEPNCVIRNYLYELASRNISQLRKDPIYERIAMIIASSF